MARGKIEFYWMERGALLLKAVCGAAHAGPLFRDYVGGWRPLR
jgi:hypothetical protein